MTISILSRIASRAKQFFLLSHDIHFVKDFYDNNQDCLNLKIVYKNESSVFIKHDIDIETMTGIYKDIYILKKYLSDGASTDLEKSFRVPKVVPKRLPAFYVPLSISIV